MADEARFSVTVVWGDELRAAAAAFDRINSFTPEQRKDENDEYAQALIDALNASNAALRGISQDSHLLICEGSRGRFVPREINVVRPEASPQK